LVLGTVDAGRPGGVIGLGPGRVALDAGRRTAAPRSKPSPWCTARGAPPIGASSARLDRVRAVDALEQAVGIFDELQAVVRRDEALSVLATLGARGRRKRADLVGPGSLSAREKEVASLAAEGLSAREIADRLFIGERTVETHLAHIYAKLGVASKVDLIRRAAELGV
jgi:DNA-binding CsgD family transcriptional regulator